MLTELEPVGAAELPLAALREHLRLGTGFADDALQDAILDAALRAALAAVETRIGRVLIARGFVWRVGRWSDPTCAVLPFGPVEALSSVEIEDARGGVTDVLERLVLSRPSGARPFVEGSHGALPRIPEGGTAVIVLAAGFGPWDSVPPDLRHAVLTLAAAYYENRSGLDGEAFPPIVAALLAPWRVMRLGAGETAVRSPVLKRRLVLESPDRMPDGAGGFREDWRPLGVLWAEVRPGLGRERQQDFAVISAVHYRVVVRASPFGAPSRPRPEQRFREGARVLRIQAVGEHDLDGKYLVCFAYEEVAA